jgi:hypothetical protein
VSSGGASIIAVEGEVLGTGVLYVEHNDDNRYMLKTRFELLGDFAVLAADDSEKQGRIRAGAAELPLAVLIVSS